MGLLSWLSLDKKRGGDSNLDRDNGAGPSKKHAAGGAAAAPKTRSRVPSEEKDPEPPSKKNAAASKKNSTQKTAVNDKKRKDERDLRKKKSLSAAAAASRKQQKDKASGSGAALKKTRGGATANGRGRSTSPQPATANGVSRRGGGGSGGGNKRKTSPSRKQQQQQQKQFSKKSGPAAADTDKKSSKKRRREPSPSSPATTSSEEEEDDDDNVPVHRQKQQQQQQGAQTTTAAAATATGGGMKRVRSSWRLRPLIVDEKLRVFVEGRDEELLHYDGGEFWKWLKDCEAGLADPSDGFPYPLVVQDSDLRTVLEIKEPPVVPPPTAAAVIAAATVKRAKKNASDGTAAITVPTWSVLPEKQRADAMLRAMDPNDVPVVNRHAGDSLGPDVNGPSAAAAAVAAAWSSAQAALASDPPFIRYVQPTPDDLDLAIEYDLDEEDEEWLAAYNESVKKHGGGNSKARSAKKPLAEEWLEHLIDRMEKEYTAELQRHPEKWVLGAGAGNNIGDGAAPEVSLPPIEEVFPLEKCLQLEGINQYESVVKAVYKYWVVKHRKAGRPLIPRLWYEPPWDKKAAARRLAATDEDGGDGVFAAHESPLALAGIRKRRMDIMEVRGRFESIRRDLEAARTLADQVRRREKLKRREAQLLKEEWAARMQDVADGQKVVVVKGRLKNRPPQVHVLRMLSKAGAHHSRSAAAQTAAAVLGFDPFDLGGEIMPAVAEDRAARLAARRDARDAAAAGFLFPTRPATAQGNATANANTRPSSSRPASAAAAVGGAGTGGAGGGGGVRGPAPAPGITRDPHCVWCGAGSDSLILGCRNCHRCFCFKCFQRRPGLGVNNWSRAVKDSRYQCVVCRGLENEEDGDLELQELGYDGAGGSGSGSVAAAAAAASRQRAERAAGRGGGSGAVSDLGDGLPKVQQPRRATGQFAPFPKSPPPPVDDEEEEEESDTTSSDSSDSDSDSSSSSSSSSSDDDDDDDSESDEEEAFFDKEESVEAEGSSDSDSSDASSDDEEEEDEEEEEEDDEAAVATASQRRAEKSHRQQLHKKDTSTKKTTKQAPSSKQKQREQRNKKQKPSTRRTSGRGGGGGGDGSSEGEEADDVAAAALEEAEAAVSTGKKVPRELLALLRRKSNASSKQAAAAKNKKIAAAKPASSKPTASKKKSAGGGAPGVVPTTATKVKKSGTAKKKGMKAAAAPAPAPTQKKRRSGSGMSRADIEIMLQQAVTTPSRKLRSGKK